MGAVSSSQKKKKKKEGVQFTHVTRMGIIKTADDIIKFPKPNQTKPAT